MKETKTEDAKAREKLKSMVDELTFNVVTDILNTYDPIIHVDRTAPVVYPDWVEKALYPRFEQVGPSDFNVTELESYLCPKIDGTVRGNKLHEELIAEKVIEDCLGLNDLKAIRARGIGFFRRYYFRKTVFGWRSVVQHRYGRLLVPYLIGNDDEVVLLWSWLDDDWRSNFPALYFRK